MRAHFIHGFNDMPWGYAVPVFVSISSTAVTQRPLSRLRQSSSVIFHCFSGDSPQLKAFELCFRIDVDPELENDRAVIGELFFKFVDLAVGALPVVLAAVALDALDHDAAVPAAVKDRHMATARQARPEPPEIMPRKLARRGACNGDHVKPKSAGRADTPDGGCCPFRRRPSPGSR